MHHGNLVNGSKPTRSTKRRRERYEESNDVDVRTALATEKANGGELQPEACGFCYETTGVLFSFHQGYVTLDDKPRDYRSHEQCRFSACEDCLRAQEIRYKVHQGSRKLLSLDVQRKLTKPDGTMLCPACRQPAALPWSDKWVVAKMEFAGAHILRGSTAYARVRAVVMQEPMTCPACQLTHNSKSSMMQHVLGECRSLVCPNCVYEDGSGEDLVPKKYSFNELHEHLCGSSTVHNMSLKVSVSECIRTCLHRTPRNRGLWIDIMYRFIDNDTSLPVPFTRCVLRNLLTTMDLTSEASTIEDIDTLFTHFLKTWREYRSEVAQGRMV